MFEKKKRVGLYFLLSLLFIFLSAALWLFWQWWSLAFDLILLLNLFIFIAYHEDRPVPVVGSLIRREFARVRSRLKSAEEEEYLLKRFYLKILYYLVLIFKDSRRGFNLIIEDPRPLGIEFKRVKGAKAIREQYLADYLLVYQIKQKKAKLASLVGSGVTIGATVAVTLLLSLVLPIFFGARAATYGWIQTDWSGGASTTARAVSSANKTGWNYYSAKDDNISVGTSLTLTPVNATSTQTSDSDFGAGTASNTTVSGSGDDASFGLSSAYTFTNWADYFNWKYVGFQSLPGIYVSDSGYSYGAHADDFINVLDVVDPEGNYVANLSTGTIRGVAGSGNYVYVSRWDDGTITQIDISDPDAPTIKNIETNANFTGVTWDSIYAVGEKVFAANNYYGTHGLYIVDFTQATTSRVVGSIATSDPQHVFAAGNYAYVADGAAGVRMIDISNPASPSLYKTFDTDDYAFNVVADGNYAYVADKASLKVIDTTQAEGSAIIAKRTTGADNSRYIAYANNNVYLSRESLNVAIYNVATPASPYLLGYIGEPQYYDFKPKIADGKLYLFNANAESANYGLNSYDLPGTLAGPEHFSTYNTPGNSRDVFGLGDYAYVADGSGLLILDVSSPEEPVLKNPDHTLSATLTGSFGVYVVGDYAYVADTSNGLRIVDISDKTNPTVVSTICKNNVGGDACHYYKVYVSGDYAYVADYDNFGGLVIVDISDKENPSISGIYDGSGRATNVYVSGDYAYLGDPDNGVTRVIDVSNKAAPAQVSTVTGSVASSVSGNYLFAAGVYWFRVYNISNPASPEYIYGSSSAFWPVDVEISGDFAYVLDINRGLFVYDISDPSAPLVVSGYAPFYNSETAPPNDYQRLSVANGKVYIGESTNGVDIVGLSGYLSSGTFTSSAMNVGQNLAFDSASWTATTPADTTLTVKVRTGNSADMSDATDWASCDAVSNNADISANNCVDDGEPYVQYYAALATANSAVSPALADFSLAYQYYPASQTLTSSIFDTEDAANVVGDITWTETTPTGSDVKFQISTSADGETWTDFLGPTGTTTYYTVYDGNEINADHVDGVDDRYVQYKVFLTSNGLVAPTVSDITLTYVVNARPEFSQAPIAGQRESDGYVTIEYAVLDSDTDSEGAACQNCLKPSFQYSLDDGETWNNITTGLSEGATATTTGISQTVFATSTITWNAKEQVDGTYSATAKIKVTVNDGEGANNIASSTSPTFTLDVKNPATDSPAMVVVASTTPATLRLSASDDSSLEMCVTLDNTQNNCSAYGIDSSIALVDNPDTVYVIFRDAYKNTASANVITPTAPGNMVIRDVSNLDTSEYQEFIVWQAASAGTSPAFAKYELWSSTDGANYSLETTITDRTINYYLDQGLSTDNTYYYKVYTVDADGNTSVFSSTVYDKPNGQGGTDTTPPTISNVSVSATTTQSAVIVWDTDELSDSTVNYGTDTLTVSTGTGVTTLVDSASNMGQHQVVLTGLSPGQTYYFEVVSEDISGESSTDNKGSEYYTFSTKSGPVISGVTETSVFNTGATITWNTDIADNTYVVYATSTAFTNSSEAGTSEAATYHSYSLTGLTAGTIYYYYVKSGVATDDNAGAYYNFTTASDAVPPVITGIDESIITDTAAVIVWDTNEDADSAVALGVASGVYTATSSVAALTTSHSVTVTGLATSTKYFYRVNSVDASGNSNFGEEGDFTTLETLSEESAVLLREEAAREEGEASASTCPACPVCSCGGGGSIDRTKPTVGRVSISAITNNSATFSWVTDKKCSGFVEFGLTASYGQTQGKIGENTEHQIVLTGLAADTEYHYQVAAIDGNGNIGRSADAVFSTAGGSESENQLNDIINSNDNNDNILIKAASKAIEIFNQMASQVSLNTLETTLVNQYNAIRKLADALPSPILGGEPAVITSATTATVTWRTDKEANSLVALAPDEAYDSAKGDEAYIQVVGQASDNTTLHIVTISDLEPDTIYHYQVRSQLAVGPLSKSKDFTFRTKTKSLEIESYTIENISAEKAIFRWLSNIETNSQIKYAPYRSGQLMVDESKTVKDKAFSVIHELSVDDFESGVIYEVELSGQDVNGQVATRKISAFATGDDNLPPLIYQVQTESALSTGKDAKVQTVISWLTNEAATGAVYYRQGFDSNDDEGWQEVAPDSNFTKQHIVVITKFDPGVVYQFKVRSVDSTGNEAVSKIFTILTPRQKETVFQVIMKNFEEVFGWTKRLGIK